MKTIRLVFRIVTSLVVMMGTNASAQDGYSWDSVMVKNVQVWYPGPPDSGKIKAELWWHHPDVPYSAPTGFIGVSLKWTEVGITRCDSVRPELRSMLDSVHYWIRLDNQSGNIEFSMGKNPDYAFYFQPGHYHLANMYFTVHGSGLFATDSIDAPYLDNPPIDVFWLGRQFATANVIAGPGDFNGDGTVNISDCVYGIQYIFGPFDDPVPCGDANGSCFTNISDVVYLINYLFSGGPEPAAGCVFWR